MKKESTFLIFHTILSHFLKSQPSTFNSNSWNYINYFKFSSLKLNRVFTTCALDSEQWICRELCRNFMLPLVRIPIMGNRLNSSCTSLYHTSFHTEVGTYSKWQLPHYLYWTCSNYWLAARFLREKLGARQVFPWIFPVPLKLRSPLLNPWIEANAHRPFESWCLYFPLLHEEMKLWTQSETYYKI